MFRSFLTLIFLAALATQANADLVLILTSDTTTQVVIDESPLNTTSSGGSYTSTVADFLNGDGIVGYNGAVGNFIVNVTTGISDPFIGPYAIDLNNVSVSGAPGTLTIELIDTDFSLANAGIYNVLSEFGGTTDGTIDASGGVLDSNAEIGFGADTFLGPFSDGAFSGTDMTTASLSDTFSLNTVVTITHDAGGQITSFDHKFSVVPEPGTSAVLVGLSSLAWIRRRR
ncbi:MAG: PEP-CTERM sorting domain-containing protein [Planctomycetota bacterium]